MLKLRILLFFVIAILSSCKRILNCEEKEKYTFSKTTYSGNLLKTNGYFYNNTFSIIIIYLNGVLIDDKRSNYSNTLDIENDMTSGTYYRKIKNDIYRWEIFYINNHQIKSEGFSSKSGITCMYQVISTYELINDSTLLLTNEINLDGSESKLKNDTFHFKQFSPKPDSTNSFIN